jgi:hypothetical protein
LHPLLCSSTRLLMVNHAKARSVPLRVWRATAASSGWSVGRVDALAIFVGSGFEFRAIERRRLVASPATDSTPRVRCRCNPKGLAVIADTFATSKRLLTAATGRAMRCALGYLLRAAGGSCLARCRSGAVARWPQTVPRACDSGNTSTLRRRPLPVACRSEPRVTLSV